jgi:hypothetical protein
MIRCISIPCSVNHWAWRAAKLRGCAEQTIKFGGLSCYFLCKWRSCTLISLNLELRGIRYLHHIEFCELQRKIPIADVMLEMTGNAAQTEQNVPPSSLLHRPSQWRGDAWGEMSRLGAGLRLAGSWLEKQQALEQFGKHTIIQYLVFELDNRSPFSFVARLQLPIAQTLRE